MGNEPTHEEIRGIFFAIRNSARVGSRIGFENPQERTLFMEREVVVSGVAKVCQTSVNGLLPWCSRLIFRAGPINVREPPRGRGFRPE